MKHQVTLTETMNFVNEQPQSIRRKNEAGDTKTILLVKQMESMRRVINEKTSGTSETIGMCEVEIGKCVDSRNLRSAAKSEGGNHAANLGRGTGPW